MSGPESVLLEDVRCPGVGFVKENRDPRMLGPETPRRVMPGVSLRGTFACRIFVMLRLHAGWPVFVPTLFFMPEQAVESKDVAGRPGTSSLDLQAGGFDGEDVRHDGRRSAQAAGRDARGLSRPEVWGWRSEGTNLCRHVGRFKEESRERYLSESEFKRLGEVLVEAEQQWEVLPQAVTAVRLLILTGCRSAEILSLRWEDVDFERRCLYLPDSKTGRRTVVHNSGAIQILDGLERVEDNPYVLPGGKPGGHLKSLQRFWDRVRVAADIQDVRVHDLRHFASVGVNNGQSLAVIGKLLGHTKILTTQRYAHLADDPIRQASEEIGSILVAIGATSQHGDTAGRRKSH